MTKLISKLAAGIVTLVLTGGLLLGIIGRAKEVVPSYSVSGFETRIEATIALIQSR